MLSSLRHVRIDFCHLPVSFLVTEMTIVCLTEWHHPLCPTLWVGHLPQSTAAFPGVCLVQFSSGPWVAIGVVVGTRTSQRGKRQTFRCLASHGILHNATQCLFVVRDQVPMQLAAMPALLLAPVSVRALASLPAGESSCLVTFKEAVRNICPLSR